MTQCPRDEIKWVHCADVVMGGEATADLLMAHQEDTALLLGCC